MQPPPKKANRALLIGLYMQVCCIGIGCVGHEREEGKQPRRMACHPSVAVPFIRVLRWVCEGELLVKAATKARLTPCGGWRYEPSTVPVSNALGPLLSPVILPPEARVSRIPATLFFLGIPTSSTSHTFVHPYFIKYRITQAGTLALCPKLTNLSPPASVSAVDMTDRRYARGYCGESTAILRD